MPGLEINLNRYEHEEALLTALRSGEQDACTCLVKRFAGLLYQPALQILGDADEADAAVQNAFMKACDKLDSFNAESRLGTWLYRIATNEALMARRRRQNNEPIHDEDLFDLLEDPAEPALRADDHEDPLQAALHGELHLVLMQAFSQLPEPLRQVVYLRTIQGLSTAETAASLNMREGTVKVYLHRARQQLYDLLADYMGMS